MLRDDASDCFWYPSEETPLYPLVFLVRPPDVMARTPSRNQLKRGLRAGREAATIPMVSSMKFQMLNQSSVVQSGSSRTLYCWMAFTIAAAQAK